MHMPGMESGFTGNSSWAVGDMVNGRDAVVVGAGRGAMAVDGGFPTWRAINLIRHK